MQKKKKKKTTITGTGQEKDATYFKKRPIEGGGLAEGNPQGGGSGSKECGRQA